MYGGWKPYSQDPSSEPEALLVLGRVKTSVESVLEIIKDYKVMVIHVPKVQKRVIRVWSLVTLWMGSVL